MDEENPFLNHMNNLFDKIEQKQQGSFIMVTVIAKTELQIFKAVPLKEDPQIQEAEENEIFLKKPMKKLIKASQIESIEEHEKGAVIYMGFGGQKLIVEENMTFLVAQLNLEIK